MVDESDYLSPANINYQRWHVAEGTASPDDAKRILREFVRQAPAMIAFLDQHARTGDERGWTHLIEHLGACVGAYLNGRKVLEKRDPADDAITVQTKTLDKAFGLTATRSGPRTIDADTLGEVAGQVTFPSNFVFQGSLDRIGELEVGNVQGTEAGIHGGVQGTGGQAGAQRPGDRGRGA